MPELANTLIRYVQEATPATVPPFETVQARARRHLHRHMVVLSALVVLVAGGAFTGLRLSDRPLPGRTAPGPGPRDSGTQGPGPSRSGALPAGNVATDCVSTYSLRRLQNRIFAFDGTVVRIAAVSSGAGTAGLGNLGYVSVTFKVNRWFRGGSQAKVVVAMFGPAPTEGPNIEDWSTTYGVGTRLLVSGGPRWGGRPLQDPIAFPCGFTRYYDQETARSWRQVFGRQRTAPEG